jgi:hypothetical protein
MFSPVSVNFTREKKTLNGVTPAVKGYTNTTSNVFCSLEMDSLIKVEIRCLHTKFMQSLLPHKAHGEVDYRYRSLEGAEELFFLNARDNIKVFI